MMYQRIKELAKKAGVSINQLEKELGIAKGYLSKIDTLKPSNERLTSIANYFGVSLEYLTTGEEKEGGETYYLNDEAREMAQFMFENPEYKVLFDASRKVSKDDIATVKAIMDKFRSDE